MIMGGSGQRQSKVFVQFYRNGKLTGEMKWLYRAGTLSTAINAGVKQALKMIDKELLKERRESDDRIKVSVFDLNEDGSIRRQVISAVLEFDGVALD